MTARIPVALAATFTLLLIPVGGASASLRTDGKALLKPMKKFTSAVGDRKITNAKVESAVAKQIQPCQADVGKLMEDEAKAEAVVTLMALDVMQFFLAPVATELAAAARSYAKVRVKDKVLRSWARAKSRELTGVLRVPDTDTCALVGEWKANGYAADKAPDPLAGLPASVRSAVESPGTSSSKAKKRMRKAGLSARNVALLTNFPLIP